jgi:hypothetical protein
MGMIGSGRATVIFSGVGVDDGSQESIHMLGLDERRQSSGGSLGPDAGDALGVLGVGHDAAACFLAIS